MFHLQKLSRYELIVFGLMAIMLEIAHCLLSNISDTTLVSSVGPEGISFIRIFITTPLIFGTIYIYNLFMYSERKEITFYIFMISTVALLLIYTYILHPYAHVFDMKKETIEHLSREYHAFQIPIKVFGNFTSTFLHCIFTTFSSVIYGLILWKVADEAIYQKKIVFPIISLIISSTDILSNSLIQSINFYFPIWEQTIAIYTGFFVVCILFVCMAYNVINLSLKKHTFFELSKKNPNPPKRISIKESAEFIFKNKTVFYLVISVFLGLGGVVFNLLWKSEVRIIYPKHIDYSSFMAKVGIVSGVGYVIMSLLAIYTLNRFKWIFNATISTILFFFFSCIFFTLFQHINEGLDWTILKPIVFLWMGAFFLIIYYGTDLQMYAPSARLTYDKMTPEEVTYARSGFEMLGRNMGGLFISIIIQVLLCFGTINDMSIILGGLVILMCIARFYYIRKLGNKLKM